MSSSVQMWDEPQSAVDKRVSTELPDNEGAAKLLALIPDTRLDVVREGVAYDVRVCSDRHVGRPKSEFKNGFYASMPQGARVWQ